MLFFNDIDSTKMIDNGLASQSQTFGTIKNLVCNVPLVAIF